MINEELNERDIIKAFNLSQEPVENDSDPERCVQINFDEFVEAFARIAEKVSMVPYGNRSEEWPPEVRISQPLEAKLENFIDFFDNYTLIKLQGEAADLFDGEQYYTGTEKHTLKQTASTKSIIENFYKVSQKKLEE